jgi:hypothetical protein
VFLVALLSELFEKQAIIEQAIKRDVNKILGIPLSMVAG